MASRFNLGEGINRALDRLIAVISGKTPAGSLEGQQAWRLTLTIGMIALASSGFLIWRAIRATVYHPPVTANTNATTAVAELEKLRTKDTDQDGLSDYDELFSLQTSPYLNDSDSDGLSDSDELRGNLDPNCPKEKICGQVPTDTTATAGELSPAFLRQALRAAGVPQTTLEGLSDQDILRLYQQVASVSGINANAAGNTNEAVGAPTLAALEGMSPAEIRALLIESGIDETTLTNIDDATLKEIFQEAINSETQP